MSDMIIHQPPVSGEVIEPRCTCGSWPAWCERHVLTDVERAAVEVLWEKCDNIGRDGYGGFYAGQAEEVILVLRQAGFRMTRVVETASPFSVVEATPA